MRQGQQNRRGRGRNHNHSHHQGRRGGQNPLTRSFESTGPDTKIRGTPAHIAEKYMALARDAHSAGDPVLAENYLQHAEHYNRIILAYREQMAQSGEFNGQQPMIARYRPGGQDPLGEDDGDGEGEELGDGQQPVRGSEPQPSIFENGQAPRESQPQRVDAPREPLNQPERGPRTEGQHRQHNQYRDRDRGERGFQGERRDRQEGYNRHERQDRQDRGDRPERYERPDRGDRPERGERHEPRFERQAAPEGPSEAGGPPRRAPRGGPTAHEQPEFLRRSVARRPRREEGEGEAPPAVVPAADEPDRE